MAELSGVEALQSEIEKSKDKLRGYNENIKKLTGRDPSRPGVRRFLSGEGTEREEDGFSGRMARGRGRLFGLARRSIVEDSGPPAKRRVIGGAFSRLGPAPMPARRKEREDSPYEEELPHKLSVQSSVVATSREAKNRQEILQEQTKDKEGMQRNRRMFGLLLGTLNKFKTESKTLETKEVQRKKIEEKLEENAEKEKRKFKMETKLLMEEMHLEQSKISRLQQKMEMVQEHSEREEEMRKLKNFICTKTKPRIFWRPRQLNTMLETKLKDSKKVVDGMLQEGQDRLEKEIKELMERENKREERIKMRLREDGLLEDGEGEEGDKADKDDREVGRVGTGRVVGATEHTNSEKLVSKHSYRHVEEKGSDDENEEIERNKDYSKKSRRTVIVEQDRGESGGSESDDVPSVQEKSDDVEKLEKQATSRTQQEMSEKNRVGEESSSGSDDERGEIKERTSLERLKGGKEGGKRRKSSGDNDDDRNEDRNKSNVSHKKDRIEERSRNRDEVELTDKSKGRKEEERKKSNDSRDKERSSRDKDRESQERERDKDRSGRDSEKSSRHRDRSGKDRREDRRDKDSKKSRGSDRKKHSRHHGRSRNRSSESGGSDVEVKKEKEDDKSKSKDYHGSEERERTEKKGSDNSQRHPVNLNRTDEKENESGESESEQNNSA